MDQKGRCNKMLHKTYLLQKEINRLKIKGCETILNEIRTHKTAVVAVLFADK